MTIWNTDTPMSETTKKQKRFDDPLGRFIDAWGEPTAAARELADEHCIDLADCWEFITFERSPKITVDCVRKAALTGYFTARREIAKLKEANTKLEETNTKLEETNTKLEEANTKLEETNAKLKEAGGKMVEGAMKLKEFWENAI